MKNNHRNTHRCIHGEIVSTFNSICKINAGNKGWKSSVDGRCPWIWSISDCPMHENNKEYRY